MRTRYGILVAGALAVGLLGCSDSDPQGLALAEHTQPIVYGKDDRREVYEHPDPAVRSLAQSSILALIPNTRVQRSSTGEVRLFSPTLGEAYELCSDQRFVDQQVAADCTGVLIDRDLVLSAGHCFEEQDCADFTYAFDYFYRGEEQLEEMGSSDLYACRRLVAREMQVLRSGARLDFAIVQLDRPVIGRKAVKLRTTPLAEREPMSVIGTGSGLPFKLDTGAWVIDPRASVNDYFGIEADTFEGSSGSGVFDATGALAGVLVRGGTDYIEDPTLGCYRVQERAMAVQGDLPMGELGHEQATYVQRAVQALCETGFPSPTLCNIEPSCGDQFCSPGETRTTCPQDCDACTSDGGLCGAQTDQPSAAGDEVKQSSRSWKKRSGDCSVNSRPSAGFGWLWLALLGLASARLVRPRRVTIER